MQKTFPLLALAALAACGDGSGGTGPADPNRNCNVGSIEVGGTRDFTLGAGFGCVTSNVSFEPGSPENVFAASYTVQLEAGTPYSIQAVDRGGPTDPVLDLTLLLYGPGDDRSQYGWIAASDDDGDDPQGYNPQLVFVPSRTGTYSVRVSGYFDIDEGPARLTVRACDRGTTPGATAVTGSIGSSACTLVGTPFVVHQVTLPANASRTVIVHSDDFQPSLFVGGPGQDIWDYGNFGNVYDIDIAEVSDASVSFTTARAGTYTILVGSYSGELGSYSLRVINNVAQSRGISASLEDAWVGPRARTKAARR